MKESNYCLRPRCQKLIDAGIKIETENHWCHWDNGEWTLGNGIMETPREFIPAPTFAEISSGKAGMILSCYLVTKNKK